MTTKCAKNAHSNTVRTSLWLAAKFPGKDNTLRRMSLKRGSATKCKLVAVDPKLHTTYYTLQHILGPRLYLFAE